MSNNCTKRSRKWKGFWENVFGVLFTVTPHTRGTREDNGTVCVFSSLSKTLSITF